MELFDGHIACDSSTRSEIVVPLVDHQNGRVVGVLDLDCETPDGFGEEDKTGLESFAKILTDSCVWW